jgi:hypothetical protein
MGLELMIVIFSVFEVMELHENFVEKPYDPGEHKLT